ncbi:phage tail protein [Eubacterium limosum]|nr:phage tail protein [Eubacterium limosum]
MISNRNIKVLLRSGGQTIEIGKNLEYRLLEKPTGIESSEYTIETENNNQYDGDTVLNKRIEKRPISIKFEYPKTIDAADKRKFLIGFFNPKRTGSIEVDYCGQRRYIEYEVVSLKDNQETLFGTLKMLVELICPEPTFKEIYEDETVIETWINGWQWPFSLPFKMRERGPQRLMVHNSGHLATPVQIIFPGPALNPQVINHTIGKFMKINRSLGPYDVLYVNTDFGKKSVEIVRENGQRENAFDYIDIQNKFFELEVGDNDIEFKCDDADLVPQEVRIRYRNRYLGV